MSKGAGVEDGRPWMHDSRPLKEQTGGSPNRSLSGPPPARLPRLLHRAQPARGNRCIGHQDGGGTNGRDKASRPMARRGAPRGDETMLLVFNVNNLVKTFDDGGVTAIRCCVGPAAHGHSSCATAPARCTRSCSSSTRR